MKPNKWMTTAAVLALSTSLAFAAPHEGGNHGKQGRRGGQEFGERFAKKLNLSEAQKQQMRDLQSSFRTQNKAFFEQSRATRQQMKEARKANDTTRLDALKPAMEAQRTQMKQVREAQHQRMLSILTPEQRAQLETLKNERQSRRGKRGRGAGQ